MCSYREVTSSGVSSKTVIPEHGKSKVKLINPQAVVRDIFALGVSLFAPRIRRDGRLIAVKPGNFVYTLHELASTLTQQVIPPAPNGTTGPLLANFSVIPPDPPAGSAWAAAEILLAEASLEYPAPYIYVSNRNTGVQDPRGDAIVVFQVEPELKLLNYVYTGLDQIRGMMIGGPNDEYIIAGSYAGSAGVAMFKRTEGGSNLTLIARNAEYPTRTSFVWL